MDKFKDLVKILNSRPEMIPDYRFKLDPIYNSNTIKDYELPHVEFIGYADSVIKDITIVPSDLLLKVICNPDNFAIVKWINRKLYMEMLNNLLQGNISQLKTRCVRLRIASNMAINTAVLLTKEERIEWVQHFIQVYYNRCFTINSYYSTEILELPF